VVRLGAQEREAAVAVLDEVLGGETSHGAFVASAHVAPAAVRAAEQPHEGKGAEGVDDRRLPLLRGALEAGFDEEAVDLPFTDKVGDVAEVGDVADRDADAAGGGRLKDAFEEGGDDRKARERVGHADREEAQAPERGRARGTSNPLGGVEIAELRRGLAHLGRERGVDGGMSAEHARHGAHGDTSTGRHILDRGHVLPTP
jgi:hypothetical protein